jgi:hypothetical protein
VVQADELVTPRRTGLALLLGVPLAALLATFACQETAPRPAEGGSAPEEAPPTPRETQRGTPVELLITGDDDGYLDACGCDDGLLGGLPRRKSLMRYLGVEDGHALVLSNGGIVPLRPGLPPESPERELDLLKLDYQLLAMLDMHCAAIALTECELALGRAALVAAAASLGDDCPFVATNLFDTRTAADSTQPELPFRRSVVRTVRDRTIAVFAVLAPSHAAAVTGADAHVRLEPMAAALRAGLGKVAERGKPWKTVVLAQADAEEAKQLAQEVPTIDVMVIPSPDGEDAPEEKSLRVGTTDILTTGRKGKFVVRYRFGVDGGRASWKAEDVNDGLDKDPSIKELLDGYRDRLKDELPIRRWYGRTPDPGGVAYVGSDESCANCHAQAWKTWQASRHARAWKTLQDQDLPPPPDLKKGHLKNAVFDPDCVRCHTTGFGLASGYRGSEKEDPKAPLVNVGCEACHGPSGDHAERAARGDPTYPGGHLPSVANGTANGLCMRCHDPDNSPQFVLKEYWVGQVHGEQREAVAHGKE